MRARGLGLLLASTLCVQAPGCTRNDADDRSFPGGNNLAYGKPYTLTPAPSYAACTDAGDMQQLTDGKFHGATWWKATTVGWSDPPAPPTVVIDLGRTAPIDEVRIYSVGGGLAGVYYPAEILVLISDDDDTFHMVGAVDPVDLPQEYTNSRTAPKVRHTFSVGGLATRGRYVMVVLEPECKFVIADEIEVLGGEHDPRRVTFAPDNHFRRADISSLLPTTRARTAVRTGLLRLHAAAGNSADDFRAALDDLDQRVTMTPAYRAADWRQRRNELGVLRARWLKQQVGHPLAWMIADANEPVRPWDLPPQDGRMTGSLHIELRPGEYESAAVALWNCSEAPRRWRVDVTNLKSDNGAEVPAAQMLTLRQAIAADSRGTSLTEAPLVGAGPHDIDLAPGQCAELWLTVHDPALGSSTYRFALRFVPASDESPASASVEIPGEIVVRSVQAPTPHAVTEERVRRGNGES